jgi:CubicO group peptidase (beta-lactamase class C family)
MAFVRNHSEALMSEHEQIEAVWLLRTSITEGVFPAAVVEVGSRDGVLWREAFGTITFEPSAAPAAEDTIFDLASLTKPIATTSVILQLMAEHALSVETPVAACFPEWSGTERAPATLLDLLEHSSGLPSRLLDAPPVTRREFEHEICALPLEYAPRTRSIYSDLDFILLGFLAEDRGQGTLAQQFGSILSRLTTIDPRGETDFLAFDVPAAARERAAPTVAMPEDLRRGQTLKGDVHDNYAAALGGVAGHAGLFGTAGGVGWFARIVLRAALDDRSIPPPLTSELVHLATQRSRVPGSSRALGWDTMLPTSSCGAHLSPAAFGHVGFTGTSLWIDPVLDRYFVLLTNRVCGRGTSDQMQVVRRRFHDLMSKL